MTALAAAFRIQPATDAEIAELAAVERAAFPDPWTPAALAGFWREPGARAWLGRDPNGAAVGGALFRVVAAAHEAELLRVATAPAWRRRGVATALLTAALAELDRESVVCFLEVRADNRPAQDLYLRLGFQDVDRRRGYYSDGCDARIYVRRP